MLIRREKMQCQGNNEERLNRSKETVKDMNLCFRRLKFHFQSKTRSKEIKYPEQCNIVERGENNKSSKGNFLDCIPESLVRYKFQT